MIPDTKNGLPRNGLRLSDAEKHPSRPGARSDGVCVELMHTSKAFHTMVCNRLEVICHEDLDTLAAPWVVPFVATALAQSKERYPRRSIGEARLMVGNAIRMMARAPKSRAGSHFAAAIGLRSLLGGFRPRRSLTGPTISTRWQVASWAVASTISAKRARG